MTTSWADEANEADLRNWLVDYMVTTIGSRFEEIDLNAPLNQLGLGSRDTVVLARELSEMLGRPVSPVDFWENPTINTLAHRLLNPDAEPTPGSVPGVGECGSLDEPIAVVGLGCRLPGDIHGPDAFWQFLAEGRSAVGKVPDERWQGFDDGSAEVCAALARTTRWGAFLDNVAAFDAEYFDISPSEADKIDPQQRLLLEVAVEALDHAGIPPESLRRTQTGVFAGACVSEYGVLASRDLGRIDAWTCTGGALSIIANRLSYFLDIRGPSVTVDTACSSSLVAIHLACKSLRTGESDLALAAGVNLVLSPAVTGGFDAAGAMSQSGACRAFDAGADGFVRGEGCGVVVLKRLCEALRDGNRVRAVVRGSAINQDGRSNGLMAPNPAAQAAVLRAACADAGVDPREVDYVEAHGTGTLLGDPIEARGLGSVYGRGRAPDSPLLIGSVKTNVGHLEAAAGVTGFIKATLAVQRGLIPASLHFDTANPHIPFEELGLKVVDELRSWPSTGRPRRAGVSSFGFGGTNAHLVLEQAPPASPSLRLADAPVTTLVVAGKTAQRVASWAGALADWMDGAGAVVPLADIAHTLNHHRSRQGSFATVAARTREQAVAGLRALAAGQSALGVVEPHNGPCSPGVVFVYSGQGSQWAGMGQRLLADEPAFAAAVDELEPEFVAQTGFSLKQVLAGGDPVVGIECIQPVLVGMQLALTALWRAYGVQPDAVIGHSMGEVSAAVVAGALSTAEGLRVITTRSRLMSRLSGQGTMALLKLDRAGTEALISAYPEVTLAVYASSRQSVIAGPPAEIDTLCAAVQQHNRLARRVDVDVASHHSTIDPVLPQLRSALADLAPAAPIIPIITTTRERTDGTPVFDADHWATNLRNPVRFQQAIATAGADHTTFIEISPHPLLTHAITETLAGTHHHSIGTLQGYADETLTFHTNLNTTSTTHPPQTPHLPEPHPPLPSTPWQHTHHWITTTHASTTALEHPGRNGVAVNPTGTGSTELDAWSYQLEWPVLPLPSGPSAAIARSGSWLVVSDQGLSDELARVADPGSRVEFLAPPAPDDDATGLHDLLDGVDNVLYAPPVAAEPVDVESAYHVFYAARRLAAAMIATDSKPKLIVLTRNAQPVTEGERANPAHAVLWGLGRTLALEHPEIWGGVVDLDESIPPELAARYVLDEAAGIDGEDQVVYRLGVRRAPRLARRTAPAASVTLGLDNGEATSQLVIEATGNIGPHLIRQLVQMGAKTIVAVSRNPGTRLAELAESLDPAGTNLIAVAADATDPAAMTALFDRFGVDLPPLEGIYLAAFAGEPVLLIDMTDDDVAAMFRPKLDAARLLHRLSLKQPVKHFVSFSSISGLIGSRWLAHYTATSAFLDTLGYARRLMGLPATVVAWGLWKSLADAQQDASQVSAESGLLPMADEVAIGALPLAMSPGAGVHSVVVAADWPLLAAAYRTRGALRIVDDLLPAPGEAPMPESEFRKALRDCQAGRRHDMLFDHVGALAAKVMGMPPTETLDPSAGFFQLGMDSLMSVTLQRALSDSLGEFLPASVVFDYPTVYSLTDYLATILPELLETCQQPTAGAYDEFIEAELLEQLSERLRGTQ